MDPLEVLQQMVGSANEDWFVAPHVEYHWDCPVTGLSDDQLPQAVKVVKIHICVGQSFGV